MAVGDILTEKKKIIIGENCTEEPFYVQWLNRSSGKSYWLFGIRNTEKVTTKEVGYYEKYVADLLEQGNDGIISKSNERTITVGANVPKSQMDGMTGLFTSPKVKHLTENFFPAEPATWQDIRIKTGSMVINQTRKDFYDVSFEVILPKQYVISE